MATFQHYFILCKMANDNNSGPILRHSQGSVEIITVNAPTTRNALTLEMCQSLQRSVLDASAAPSARVVVITGAGKRSFISGADISEFRRTRADPAVARTAYEAVDQLCRTIQTLSLPVIAMINGFAVGAGCELAAACDLRVASTSAKLGITAAKLGINIGQSHIARLVHLVGMGTARDLLFTARLVSADEAKDMGLVDKVADPDELATTTMEMANQIAEMAPLSVGWAKAAILRVAEHPDLAYSGDDIYQVLACYGTSDFWEGVSAFEDKRKPNFTGS